MVLVRRTVELTDDDRDLVTIALEGHADKVTLKRREFARQLEITRRFNPRSYQLIEVIAADVDECDETSGRIHQLISQIRRDP